MFAGTFAIANTAIASFLPTYLTIERGMDATVATTISRLSQPAADSSPSRGAFGALPTRKGWKRGAECDRMEKTNEEKGGNCL